MSTDAPRRLPNACLARDSPIGWDTDRWTPLSEAWPLDWVARSCGYCGGIHPADALRLIEMGWEVHPSKPGYKAYLERPGHRRSMAAALRSITSHGEMPTGTDYVKSITPPAKLYARHFTPSEWTTIAALERAQESAS